MIRFRFLRAAIALGTLSMPLLACGGRVVSIGSNADQLQAVNPSSIGGSIASCPSGFAHPNICCSGGPSQASSCGAYMTQPFHPCDTGSTTYPNPLSCCSLTDGSCVDTSTIATPPPPPPSGTCTSACAPGYWPVTASDTPVASPGKGATPPNGSQGSGVSVTCCRTLADGNAECTSSASIGNDSLPPDSTGCGSNPSNPEPVPDDAGTAVDDGGAPSDPPTGVDAGCVASDGGTTTPAQPPLGTCTIPCPAGWTVQHGAPDVCCRDNGDGTGECFSQSNGGWGGGGTSGNPGQTEPPPAPDAGSSPGTPRDCYGSASSSADGGPPATCGCESVANGQKETLDCDDAKQICTCSNGTTVSAIPYNIDGLVCAGPAKLDSMWTACGFPL